MSVEVITGTAPAVSAAALVVRVAPWTASPAAGECTLGVAIAEATLAARVTAAMASAIRDAVGTAPPAPPIVRLRARATATRLAAELPGALAVVAVTMRNARHLPALVAQLRTAGVAGVQLVWDGIAPPRPRVERHVFAVLEQARATPAGPPVVLAPDATPAAALQLLIAHRRGAP